MASGVGFEMRFPAFIVRGVFILGGAGWLLLSAMVVRAVKMVRGAVETYPTWIGWLLELVEFIKFGDKSHE